MKISNIVEAALKSLSDNKVTDGKEICIDCMMEDVEKILKEEDSWPKDLEEGRFTEYCKREGFNGPSIACAKKAAKSDDSSVRGMAAYYMNTVKPKGKDYGDVTEDINSPDYIATLID